MCTSAPMRRKTRDGYEYVCAVWERVFAFQANWTRFWCSFFFFLFFPFSQSQCVCCCCYWWCFGALFSRFCLFGFDYLFVQRTEAYAIDVFVHFHWALLGIDCRLLLQSYQSMLNISMPFSQLVKQTHDQTNNFSFIPRVLCLWMRVCTQKSPPSLLFIIMK